jgi:Xaa-Pro aminopeptidase
MKKIQEAQKYLKEMGASGWLLYDFQKNNDLALRFLDVPSHMVMKRRFFYWIPAQGQPVKIVHAIEPHVLDHCPGSKRMYASWQSLETEIKATLQGSKKVAMEYSPNNAIPYVSRVDAGTVEWVRSFGVEVMSSGDFLPHFTAVLTDAQIESQIRAAQALDQIVHNAWQWIGQQLQQRKSITEYDAQQKIAADIERMNLVTEDLPIVGVNQHSADPHYQPQKEGSSPIREGDFILIDLWAKEKGETAVFGDISRVGVAAPKPTAHQQEIFQIVRQAQKAAVALVQERLAHKKRLEGWEVDDAARRFIEKAGYGPFFTHRTGHNIEIELHGSGAHMDNLETHDMRPILPATCFSIEPGIYLPDSFGVRLEFDILVHRDSRFQITGGEQDSIVCLTGC